jgi:FkbM family methyltransferase
MSGLKKAFHAITSIVQNKKTEENKSVLSIKFKGIDVFYSEGTSLVQRLVKDGDYEPEVVEAIFENMRNCSNPIFIDIGANIGLISIAVLNKLPKTKIFAFEPGPHQYQLLKKTIEHNNLHTISLSPLALSNEKGITTFCIHSSNDASGDGFIDTERAGKTKKIKVETDTLDNWWHEMKKPAVDFIKMDTEGSEYYILKGAELLLKALKPKILIEINLKNIKNYPFTSEDLFQLIESIGYNVYSMRKERIDSGNREKLLEQNDTFLLLPV